MLSAPVNLPKPVGHAMVVCIDSARTVPAQMLKQIGYEVDHRTDPYAAMIEICRRPLVFRAVVLSLQALYRDELQMISTIRRRFPHISIWLTHTDGRQAALAEAMRMGAEGLISDDGMHSFADAQVTTPLPTTFRPAPSHLPAHEPEPARSAPTAHTDPVLTADELKALLGEDQ